jgi:hypothetical protein
LNPGFISLIVILVSTILLVSGWRQTLLPNIADAAAIAFYMSWFCLALVHFRWWGGIDLYGIAIVLAVLIVTAIATQPSLASGVHLLAIGIFMSAVYELLDHMRGIGSLLPYSVSAFGPETIIALMTAILLRKAKEQLACVSLALLFGGIMAALLQRHVSAVPFGGLRFQDQWWVAAGSVRLFALSGEYALATVRIGSKSLLNLWRGLKK